MLTIEDFSVISLEGDEWYQRNLEFEGKQVHVCLHHERCEKSLPYVERLISEVSLLSERFVEFRAAQRNSQPEYADEIMRLEIASINFFSAKQPNISEVYFSEESGGENWICVLDVNKFEFSSLYKEN